MKPFPHRWVPLVHWYVASTKQLPGDSRVKFFPESPTLKHTHSLPSEQVSVFSNLKCPSSKIKETPASSDP